MSLREWLVLIGIIVIVGVLADGYRRMRLARKRVTELSFGLEEVDAAGESYGSELPNGGARKRDEQQPVVRSHKPVSDVTRKWQQRHEESSYAPARERIEPGLSELGESQTAEIERVSAVRGESRSRSPVASDPVPVLTSVDNEEMMTLPVQEEISLPEPHSLQNETHENAAFKAEASRVEAHRSEAHRPEAIKKEMPKRAERPKAHNQERLSDRPQPHEILVINLLAKGEPFDGERLLQSVLGASLRYGDRSIFHRYACKDGTGQILFSLANGVEPGTFDINTMETSQTPATSLFMSLPGPKEAQKAFTLMEETAKQLALDLGAELKDENGSVLTHQTLEHYRQRIREFERKQLALRLSD